MGDYDYFRAILGGEKPKKVDNEYHWASRDAKTGRILKSIEHPTLLMGLLEDMKLEYHPYVSESGAFHTFDKNEYMRKALLDYIRSKR